MMLQPGPPAQTQLQFIHYFNSQPPSKQKAGMLRAPIIHPVYRHSILILSPAMELMHSLAS